MVNFQARTPRFCIEVDLDHTYHMLMMIIMIMIMMIMMVMMIIALTQSIFKLGFPDFEWK